mmetsp:Transcript_5813/g.12841  ORF Transcript_5813/g.12841 Transcript_5813/m.12841 type:complete len:296 (-) Transcript_5813:708-1595(-)
MLRVAVLTRRRCSRPAPSTASTTSSTRRPSTAVVHTTLAHATCLSCERTSSVYFSGVHLRWSTRSHLLTTTTAARPSAAASSLSLKSCCVMPSEPSITITTISARLMALRARSTDSCSAPSLESATLVLLRMPAVSIKVRRCPDGSVTSVSTASRVVPLMSHTMERSSPQMAFNRLLLPTLGRPTMAMLSGASDVSASSRDLGGGSVTMRESSSSPVPVPVMADTAMGVRPSSQKSETMRSDLTVFSHLLTASTTGFWGWFCLSHDRISRSPDCRPACPSTSSTRESASATPAAA